MDPRQFQIDYGEPGREESPYVGRTFNPSMMTAVDTVSEMAKLWYGRLISDPIRSMGNVGAGIIGNVPQINVDDSMDVRRIGQQYVAQGGTGGVGDIMNALMLYGGPGIAAGKPGVASVGIFGGEKAFGANLAMRDIAEKAIKLGKDPDEVWNATGWKPGMEGKMKFEIDDSNMKLNLGREYGHWAVLKGSVESGLKNKTLSEVLDHPKLFEQYPELGNVKINSSNTKMFGEENTRGFYSPEKNQITLNSNLTIDEAKDVLTHEIQHWVQNKEGFARGSDPKTETLTAMRESPASEALFGTKAEEVGFERYKRQAGEIESRDAAARRTWDTDMRRAVPPETRKDAIIRWGDKGAEEIATELMK